MCLLGTIGTIQEKIYGYARATEVLEMTLGVVKEEEGIELYSKVMGKLRENPEYLQLLKEDYARQKIGVMFTVNN